MRYVIIGSSAAGAQAAEDIRKLDGNSLITMICAEEPPPYSRCLISRYVDGRLDERDLYFKTARFFEDNHIEVVKAPAEEIRRSTKEVLCENGRTVTYDRLLIATGASPLALKIPGAENKLVFQFHSLSDAVRIKAAAQHSQKAIVVGAGFAGLEAAYALNSRGITVTVVERCSQILPSQFDNEAAAILQHDLEKLGVTFEFDQSLAAVEGDENQIQGVILANNERIQCDMVVVATGIRPSAHLARESGLLVDKGILINELMQSSDPDIFAGGDVAEIHDVTTGTRIVSATWINAIIQGRYAAFNMTGRARRYTEGVGIQNAVQFHRVPAISFGRTLVDVDNQDDYDVMSVRREGIYKKLILRESRIVGMIFVGDILKAGFYAALIRNGVDISKYRRRLLDDDFSYALFARNHTFGQYDPYTDTSERWYSDAWWAERPHCIAA